MRSLNVFAVPVHANHVDMVVVPMFKIASSKVSAVSMSCTLIEDSPHNGIRRIRGQEAIAILDNIDYPGFGCVDLCHGSSECLCFDRCFEYKSLGALLNCG